MEKSTGFYIFSLIVAVVVAGALIYAYNTNPNITSPTGASSGEIPADKSLDDFRDEAMELWYGDYYACLESDQGREAQCDCMAEVLDKFADLRARMVAAGYEQGAYFWVDYYVRRLKETMAAYGCSLAKPLTTTAPNPLDVLSGSLSPARSHIR